MKKQYILIGIIGLLLINVVYALFNPDGSCIVNTSCTFTLTYAGDNGTQRVDAICTVTSYDPYGNNIYNQTPMIPNSSTLDYSIIFTPNVTGLYPTMVYCQLEGNQPVIGDLSFVSDIPENETPTYVIARETINQTSIWAQIAGVFTRWAIWVGIPLYPEINIQTVVNGNPYVGNNIKFSSKVTNEFGKIITNASCIFSDMINNLTYPMSYNIITERYDVQIIPNTTGNFSWNVTCNNLTYQLGNTIIINPPGSTEGEPIINFTCNGTLPANLNVFISEWVKTGIANKVYAYYTSPYLNNSEINTGNTQVVLDMDNQSYNMTWVLSEKSWQIVLYSNNTENINFTVRAYDPDYMCKEYTQTVNFAEFVDACIKIYKDVNKTDIYKNEFGYILANLQPKNALGQKFNKDASMIMAQKVLYPVMIFSTWGEKTFGLNYTKAYKYYRKSFSSPYVKGQACLELPKDQVYNFVFVSGEWIFSNLAYDYPMWKKQDTAFNLGTSYLMNESKLFEFKVSAYEMNPKGYIWQWILIILFVIMIVGLPALAYITTKDPTIVIKLIIALITILPTIYYIIKWVWLT